MATGVKKIKFVYFVYVHPKAIHLTTYKQNLFFLPLPAILKNYLRLQLSISKVRKFQVLILLPNFCIHVVLDKFSKNPWQKEVWDMLLGDFLLIAGN